MNIIKEDEIFKAHIKDKHQKCFSKNIQTATDFLDLRQQSIVHELSRSFSVPFLLFGGYEDADRKKLYFLPDYLEKPAHGLSVVNAEFKGSASLSHRDYLGSILGLGLKRDKIGDIIVHKNGAQIIVDEEISVFINSNFFKAGRINLSVSIHDIATLKRLEQNTVIIHDTVMSLRLDALISSAFSCSRNDAVKHINSGNVYLNDFQTLKPDKPVNEGDKLILRGSGKAYLKAIGNLSKKGRINIEIEKYI